MLTIFCLMKIPYMTNTYIHMICFEKKLFACLSQKIQETTSCTEIYVLKFMGFSNQYMVFLRSTNIGVRVLEAIQEQEGKALCSKLVTQITHCNHFSKLNYFKKGPKICLKVTEVCLFSNFICTPIAVSMAIMSGRNLTR